jgi:hypothetical protein
MRQRAKAEREQRNPVRFINILHRYSYEKLGAHYLHLPRPRREIDFEVWSELQILKSVCRRKKCWLTSADEAAKAMAHTHPHLFKPAPVCFEVFRLPNLHLERFFWRL